MVDLKPETKYTLFILALAIIWKTLLFASGFHEFAFSKFPLIMLLPVYAFMLIGMFRGVNERRKSDHPGGMKFMDAFKSGASIATLFSLTYTLFIYFYITVMDDQFKSRFIAFRINGIEKSGATPEEIRSGNEVLSQFPFYTAWILFTFIGLIVMGIIYSAAIARLMSKKYPAN